MIRRVGARPAIAVEVAGDGPALVFLHGIGGHRGDWAEQMAAFAGTFRRAAWDLRGYGDSEDYDGPFAYADAASDLLAVLDAIGAERACLIGLSLGGRIALDFFGRHPDRVGALVLADTSAGSAESRDPDKIEAALALRRRPLLEGRTPADLAPALADALVAPGCAAATRARIVASLSTPRVGSYLKTLDTAVRDIDFPPFESMTVPALVLNGEHDRVAPPAMGRAMAARMPRARWVPIPGAGHLSNIENPAAFNAALAGFLLESWSETP